MTRGRANIRRGGTSISFLTLIAFVLSAMIPQGFMVGRADAGRAPTVMICTGHGAIAVASPFAPKAPAKGKGDAPCAYAGHAAPTTLAESLKATSAPYDVVLLLASPRLSSTRPGLGLAAPPPPSQGPPTLPV